MRRLVAERCLAGVDANPVAVQLARLSIWLTTLAQGRPVDVSRSPAAIRKQSRSARRQTTSYVCRRAVAARDRRCRCSRLTDSNSRCARSCARLRISRARPDDTVADVRAKEALWERLTDCVVAARVGGASRPMPGVRAGFRPMERTASSPAELRAVIDAIVRHDGTLPAAHLARRLSEARRCEPRHRFSTGLSNSATSSMRTRAGRRTRRGSTPSLGNPPWEVLGRDQDQLTRFIRESGVYRTCGRGHLNLYQPFLERALSICRRGGRVGLIVPWGIAVDDGAQVCGRSRQSTAVSKHSLASTMRSGSFPIHRGVRFAVIVANPGRTSGEIRARFGVRTQRRARRRCPDGTTRATRHIPCDSRRADLRKVGGPTLRVPDVRHADDLALLERLMSDFPPLGMR